MMSKIRIRSSIFQQKQVTHTNIREEHHHSSIVNSIKCIVRICIRIRFHTSTIRMITIRSFPPA